ncbi:MAG: hypothetical protein Kow0090_08450 [Myxococcota bacterium]
MKIVETKPPSFPEVAHERPIETRKGVRWQVLCGDAGHWRVGIYSPPESSRDEVKELEKHDCPEFFLLLYGRLTLVVAEEGGIKEIPLEAGKPALVSAPHSGFCPDGGYTGAALVIERDAFTTEYRSIIEWVSPRWGES